MKSDWSVWIFEQAPFGGIVVIDQENFVMTRAEASELFFKMSEFFLRFSDEEIEAANNLWLEYKIGEGPRPPKPLEEITGIRNERPHRTTAAPAAPSITLPIPGYVYILQGSEFYKIGCTAHLDQRMYQICPKLPFATELVWVIPTDDQFALERELHHIFRNERKNGEWFSLNDKNIDLIKQNYGGTDEYNSNQD